MNKRILDLFAGLSGALTFIAATPFDKDLFPLLPVAIQPYVIKAGIIATVLLKVLAYFAPPTPSPILESQKVSITAAPDGSKIISPIPTEPPKP